MRYGLIGAFEDGRRARGPPPRTPLKHVPLRRHVNLKVSRVSPYINSRDTRGQQPRPVRVKPPYSQRGRWLKGVLPLAQSDQRSADAGVDSELAVHLSFTPSVSSDVWEVDFLFMWASGFPKVAENAKIPLGDLEQIAMGSATNRFGADNSQRQAGRTVSAFVSYADQTKAPFSGKWRCFRP